MPTTFQTIWTAVANRARIPTGDTTTLARIKQIVNDTYRDIMLHEDWYFLIKRHVFNTASVWEYGTITVGAATTLFTLSNVATGLQETATGVSTFVGRKLLVPGGTPDSLAAYRVVTHVATHATGLLDAAWTSDAVTTTAFHLYQDEYDLPTDFLSLVDFQRYGYELPARPIGPRDMLMQKGRDTSVGKPQVFTVLDYETTGTPTTQRQLWVHPYPDKTYRTEVYYRRAATEMVSAEDQPAMPEEFRHVITDGALADVYATVNADETRAALFRGRYEQGLARMAVQHREVTGQKSGWAPKDQHRGWFKGRRVGPGSMDLGSWFDRWGSRW